MRSKLAIGVVAGLTALSVAFAAPAYALSLPPGAPATIKDVRQAIPSSMIESLASDPDQKGYNAHFSNITKYYDDPVERSKKFRFPVQGLKKVGSAGAAMVGLQMGQAMSTSAGSAIFGIDLNGAVCYGLEKNNLSLVSMVFGYDCVNALAPHVDFVPNKGQSVTYVGGVIKDVPATVAGANTAVEVQYLGYVVSRRSYHGEVSVCARVTINGQPLSTQSGAYSIAPGVLEAKFGGGFATKNPLSYTTNVQQSHAWQCAEVANANGRIAHADNVGSPGDGYSTATNTTNGITGGVVAFGMKGDVKPLEAVVANPPRTFECVVRMTDGTSVKRSSKTFSETDKSFPAPECPALPPGKVAESLDVNEVGGGETKSISSGATTPAYKAWAAKYPQCGDGSCILDLAKITNGVAVSCFSSPEGCADWMSDPAKADNYQCTYAGSPVAISECNVYGPTFKPGALPKGDTYGDPATGKEPAKSTGPTTTPQDVDLYNAGVSDASQPRRCFPSGWDALNPVQWVMQPVQCALEWAFVPTSAAVKAKLSEASHAWDDTPMGKLRPVVAAWGGMWPEVTGCKGPPVRLKIFSLDQTMYPLNACEDPLSSLAATGRVIGAVGMYLGAGLAVTRYIGATFGYTGFGSSGKGGDA